ncbi:hypothetical protein FOVSG1_014402 [Fusarium oxysporum f. sp. vasinfectum]
MNLKLPKYSAESIATYCLLRPARRLSASGISPEGRHQTHSVTVKPHSVDPAREPPLFAPNFKQSRQLFLRVPSPARRSYQL